MWYDQAEAYVEIAALGAALLAWAATRAWGRMRMLPLVVIAFGCGLYFGIQATATGYLKLPLGPMQAQMAQIWGIAPEKLEPPTR